MVQSPPENMPRIVLYLEGHMWTFGQHANDMPPDQIHPPESWGEYAEE
jgi:hypothetical protein